MYDSAGANPVYVGTPGSNQLDLYMNSGVRFSFTYSSPSSILTSCADIGLSLRGSLAATSTNTDVIMSSVNRRTAGDLVGVRNVASTVQKVSYEGQSIIGYSAAYSDFFTIRPLTFDLVYYYNGSTYTNNTTEASTRAGTSFTILSGTSDYLYVGKFTTFSSIDIEIGTAATGVTLVAEYATGASTWATLTVTDGTSNLTTSGTITFTPPANWVANAVNSQTYMWVRLKTSGAAGTVPTAKSIVSYTNGAFSVYGMAGETIPALYVDRFSRVGVGTSSPSAMLDINSDSLILRTAKTPSSAGDTGITGSVCWDSSYIYVCTATNTWKRAAISSWP